MVHLGPKKPPSRKGSVADIPRSLAQEIAALEELFTVSSDQLKKITNHFVHELERGLSTKGGTIPMNVGWVLEYPTGKETGEYLALDLGGTNLRVVLVTLKGDSTFDVTQSKYKLPDRIRTAPQDELWAFIADCITQFIHHSAEAQAVVTRGEKIPLGFTFSYPCTQYAINHGILQRWTKGFDIPGVEGHDVVKLFQTALEQRKVPVEIVAIINDTTGTLVASRYTDSQAEMGLIFGTGCNGAYYDVVRNIPKIRDNLPEGISLDDRMAINCEYGAFDNEHVVLPRTRWDEEIDATSPRPNQQCFEKMIAGYYLGEVMRLVLIDLADAGVMFAGQDVSILKSKPYLLDTSFLSKIEEDPFENLSDVEALFLKELKLETSQAERELIRRLAEMIGLRAARLSVCGIAAICRKMGITRCHCAADGSVFNKYPGFKERAAQALRDIFDWECSPAEYPITIQPAEDGSGVGAAVIAALTKKRIDAGLPVGLAKWPSEE